MAHSQDPAAAGHRGLQLEEALIFELGAEGRSGVDLPEPAPVEDRLGGLGRHRAIGLPGLSEPQVVRHFTRLSQKNYGIDSGLYPLGSCTMKHNPRLNEKLARVPGLADIHPLQPAATVQGALELIDTLAHWLITLTGLDAGSARQVKDVLAERVRAGVTVVMTTHILEVAERMADRIGIIDNGRLIAEGTLEELRCQVGKSDSNLEDIFLDLVAEQGAA